MESVIVDQSRNRLCKGERHLELRPLVIDIAVIFANCAPGTVVSKAELAKEAWRRSHVSDEAMSQAMFVLRKALHSLAVEGTVLTIRKRGYSLSEGLVFLVADSQGGLAPGGYATPDL